MTTPEQLRIGQRLYEDAVARVEAANQSGDGKALIDAMADMDRAQARVRSANEQAAERINRLTAELPDLSGDPESGPLPDERSLGGQVACVASALTPSPLPTPYHNEVAPGRTLIYTGVHTATKGGSVMIYGGPVGWFIGAGLIVGGFGLIGSAWAITVSRCNKRGDDGGSR